MMRSSSSTSRCSSNTRPSEIHVAVGTDREVRAVRRMVALQQEAVQLFVVRGRVGHEVHLVAQRALVQIEVDRRRVAPVATEAHVPARDLRVVLDRLHERLARDRPFEVRGDQVVLGAPHLRERAARRVSMTATASVAADGFARDEVAVEAPQARGGHAPRVAQRARRGRAAHVARELRVAEELVDRHRVLERIAAVDEESGFAVGRRANAGRRPRRRRRACRRPRPRARRARTTRCATARRTRRRRGSSRRGGRAPAAAPSGSGRRPRGRARAGARAAARRAPSGPLGPPTTTSVAAGSSSAARQRTARSVPFSGWMRPTNSSTRSASMPRRRARRGGVAGREHVMVDAGRHDLDALRIGVVERRRAARARRRSTRASGRRTRRPRARRACDVRDRRRSRRRPSPARACGTSRRAAGRARASGGARPRRTTSSCRAATSTGSRCEHALQATRRRTARRARAARASGPDGAVRRRRAARESRARPRRPGLRAVLGARVDVALDSGARRRADARARTYTFIPPPSPAPGCANGDVCIEKTAMRRAGIGGEVSQACRRRPAPRPERRARPGVSPLRRRARPGTTGRSRRGPAFGAR